MRHEFVPDEGELVPRAAPVLVDPDTEERIRYWLRTAGLGLLVGGLLVSAVSKRVVILRARLRELDASFWNAAGDPGSELVLGALMLLDASDEIASHERRRSAS